VEARPLAEIADRTGLPEFELSALRIRLESEPAILVAYLFGSRASGRQHPLSDLDVAIVTGEGADEHALRARLASDLERVLDRTVDVVALRGSGPDLAWPVHRDGLLILNRNEAARVEARWLAWREYADTEHFRRLRDDALRAWYRGDR